MTYGPLDFIALEFKGNQFKGDVLASLLELVQQKIVRVIDLVIVVKDDGCRRPRGGGSVAGFGFLSP